MRKKRAGSVRLLEAASAVSSVPGAGLVSFMPVKWGVKSGSLKGSYTVEAALVMSITLFFIMGLLQGVFDVHSRVTGNFLLQEAVEQMVFAREDGRDEEVRISEIQIMAQNRLAGFFCCEEMKLELAKNGNRMEGSVEMEAFPGKRKIITELSVKEYKPEETLRIQAAVSGRNRREKSGSSLQERNEP